MNTFTLEDAVSDDVHLYLMDKTILQKHQLYVNICSYFNNAFDLNDKTANDLDFAFYLYFRSILEYDDLLDSGLYKAKYYRYGIIFQEESIKRLSVYFQQNSDFWNFFHKIKVVYTEAIGMEKNKNISGQFTIEDFLEITKGKVILITAVPMALRILSKKENAEELCKKISQSLIYIHYAFQLFDDIVDFEKDIETGQTTYTYCKLYQFLKERGIVYTLSQQKKYLYLTGIAQEHLNMALDYLQKGIDQVEGLCLYDYVNLIENRKQVITHFIETITDQINKTKNYN